MPDDPRDVYTPKTPPRGVPSAAPDAEIEEVTGMHTSPEQLAAWRADRPLGERVAATETKIDGLAAGQHTLVSDLQLIARSTAKHSGQLSYLVKSAGAATAERKKRAAAEAAALEAGRLERADKRKLIVPVITAIFVGLAGVVAAAAWMR